MALEQVQTRTWCLFFFLKLIFVPLEYEVQVVSTVINLQNSLPEENSVMQVIKLMKKEGEHGG